MGTIGGRFITANGWIVQNYSLPKIDINRQAVQATKQRSITDSESQALNNLVGIWNGKYFAGQRETGLTLTVYKEKSDYKVIFYFYNIPSRTNSPRNCKTPWHPLKSTLCPPHQRQDCMDTAASEARQRK